MAEDYSEGADPEDAQLEIRRVRHWGAFGGVEALSFETNDGTISGRYHHAPDGRVGVIWVSGPAGGVVGPAGGVYERLARRLSLEGIASLRLDYRYPGDLMACVLDALAGIRYLEALERDQVLIVGHSFGGAVAITAAALSAAVVGVVALSSQNAGTNLVSGLSPRPLLLAHGEDDDVLTSDCSRDLYERAQEPKDLILYPGAGHGLEECREALDRDLMDWIRATAAEQRLPAHVDG